MKNKLRKSQDGSSYILRYPTYKLIIKSSRLQYKIFIVIASHTYSAYLSDGKLYPFEAKFDRRLQTPPNNILYYNGVSPKHSFPGQQTIRPSEDTHI